jgi:nitrite reductase/ring-hydroxylating ferredoxin subunit
LGSTNDGAVDVGSVDDYPSGTFRVVDVDKRQIGVLRWADKWYAVRNICPHLGAPVCAGPVHGLLSERVPGNADLSFDPRPILMCPWHRWEYDLESGIRVGGTEPLKQYQVEVRSARVLVLGTRAVR